MLTTRLAIALPLVSLVALALGPGCGSDELGLAARDGGGPLIVVDDGGGAGTDAAPKPIGTLTGKVVAPEGTIPIAGALVYLTKRTPAAIPSGVYCDKCVQLDSFAFTYSASDGTFRLPAYEEGESFIVTQKGQFRRIRRVTVTKDEQAVPADYTRLPGRTDDANGDTIPRMKVMEANYDAIANSLRKLGITQLDGPPPQSFPPPPADDTLEKQAKMNQYHIVFVPCSGAFDSDQPSGGVCKNLYAPDDADQAVAKKFVQAGGKLYVTDWSYEYVNQTWPGFIQFKRRNGTGVGSACTRDTYSGPAQWNDDSLRDWMTAIGEKNATLEKSYVRIESTRPQPGIDEEGKSVTITPKVWASTSVSGGSIPSTVSFQDKCGRVLYSTYHAEGTDNGGSKTLLAQEKALFHVLLEVSTCVGVKPEPPR